MGPRRDDAPTAVAIRAMVSDDIDASFALFAAVAAEGRWIAREAPVDRDESRSYLQARIDDAESETFVAIGTATGGLVGQIGLVRAPYGVVDLGMLVAKRWRSRGVGSRLLETGIAWSRDVGAHKVALQVWPHNERALGLYEKFGFEREGVLRRHYLRSNGELWDAVIMGLLLR